MSNPLLNYTGLPAFSKIKPEHIKPAVEAERIAAFRFENYLQFLSEIENRRETYKKTAKKLPK